ncbi:hypothetical protein BTR14_04085 [Rhizobium rhizosphaerae]|uniref:Uncharacterized protein n=1 Tax=Xaviernesmea rhizosphaerae TaxID=1672749 RepID=A0ABX3PH28_9HYPH|nr:hypothetical protein [Xaviernesmea rhizosphaerae]OQP87748.1 hypothetical protein BTR14_04085 [Xaviernesmea rhizosphaerae]
MFVSPKGWATFAWQSDYGQFYLIDGEDAAFEAPVEITEAMAAQSFFVMPAGITVYTGSCLQQHIRIAIYDREPDAQQSEPISGHPWTRLETAEVRFPSKSFQISSPSMPYPLPNGPLFRVDSVRCAVRLSWKEFEGHRDDSVPVEPDVIDITIWPAP